MKRREALKLIGIGGATASAITAQDARHMAQTQPSTDQSTKSPDVSKRVVNERKYFSQHEYDVISRFADLIIPKDSTPGALEAGVPAYVDLQTSEMPDVQVTISGGIQWIDRHCDEQFGSLFLNCSEVQQRQVLDRLVGAEDSSQELRAARVFFSRIRELVCDGFYSSKFGFSELGYKGNTATVWRGCTHPEHGL